MKRVSPALITMFFAALCCAITERLASHYEALYRHTTAEAKQTLALKCQKLTERLDRREAEEPGNLMELRVWGIISTTDKVPSYPFNPQSQMAVTNGQRLQIYPSKGSEYVEIRLTAGSTNVYELEVPFGNVIGVWLADAEPYDDLAAFEQFHAYPSGTNTLKLVVQAKSGVSVSMRFSLILLKEWAWFY